MERDAYLNHWHARKPDGALPSWEAFSVNAPPDVMSRLAMHEMPDAGTIICRHFGTDLIGIWGQDMTGMNITAAFTNSPSLDSAIAVMHQAATHPCGGVVEGVWVTANGQAYAREQIYLPLTPASDETPRVLSYAHHEDILEHGWTGNQIGIAEYAFKEWIDVGWGVPEPSGT